MVLITAVELSLFFGPADFSQGIGAPGQWDHPLIAETKIRVAKVARTYGKFAGIPGNVNNLRELIDMGYQFISVASDVVGLSEYFKQISASFNGGIVNDIKSIHGSKQADRNNSKE